MGAGAIRSLNKKGIIVEVELKKMRTWMFFGHFVLRNCIVHIPGSCRCARNSNKDITLRVRSLAADLAVGKLLCSGGRKVEVRDFQVEGVDAVVKEQMSGGNSD